MIKKISKPSRNGVHQKPSELYVADEIKNSSAVKKDEIVKILDEGDQLTLLATIVEQIGDLLNLDTVEFTYAKSEFAKIRSVLNG